MKIFGINAEPGNENLEITEDDRNWVLDNSRWLRDALGYPKKYLQPVLFTAEFFPVTLSAVKIEVENVVTDLSCLFNIRRNSVKLELITDIRDMQNVPYEMGDNIFHADTKLEKGNYTLFVANSAVTYPSWLVHCLICEFACIRLTESNVPFDDGGDDNGLFAYLAAVHQGFGVMLANSMRDFGRIEDGQMEYRWNYIAKLPEPVMAFALAVHARLLNTNNPSWRDLFQKEFRKMFEASLVYVYKHVTDLYNEREAQASDLFDQSEKYYESGDHESAMAALQKVLFLTEENDMKAIVYNNMGYYHLMKSEYRQAILNLEKAITLNPEFAFAVDNLGYSLIMTGDLESGFLYLQKALTMEGNDPGYTYRNLALYYSRKNERGRAAEFFRKSFEQDAPVDLLEFQYADFLLEGGELEKAKQFLLVSVAKNEQLGIAKARQLGLL